MTVLAIDYVQLAVPPGGADAAHSFYDGLLGRPERPKPSGLAKRRGCWFERDTLKVCLGVEQGFRLARKAPPAFRVEGLPTSTAKLGATGCVVKTNDLLAGYDHIYVDDPFGNRIELLEPVGP